MLAEIASGLSGLKAAMDITKGLTSAAGEAALNQAKIDLQGRILNAQAGLVAAQESQSDNLRRISELEGELEKLDRWERERTRYSLREFPTGVFAYSLRSDQADGEPQHYLCPNCYEDGFKSIMQTLFRERGGHIVDCLRCKARLELSKAPPEPIDYSSRRYV